MIRPVAIDLRPYLAVPPFVGEPGPCSCSACRYHEHITGRPAPLLPALGAHRAALVQVGRTRNRRETGGGRHTAGQVAMRDESGRWRFRLASGELVEQLWSPASADWPMGEGAAVKLEITHAVTAAGLVAQARRVRLAERGR